MPPVILPTTIRLDPDVLAFVDEERRRQGCSRSFFISDVLKKYREWLMETERKATRKGK